MSFVQQFLTDYWVAILVVIIALTILLILLYRWFVIKKVTLGPVEFERKSSQAPSPTPSTSPSPQPSSSTASDNLMVGENKIGIKGKDAHADRNKMLGKNQINIDTQEESKRGKKKK
jgi:hypothetical protein